MNGCLSADCDIPKMKRNSYQVAVADAPVFPKQTSKVSEKTVGESELFVKRNYNNNLEEDIFLANDSLASDVTDSVAKLSSNKKSNTPVLFSKSQKYKKLQVVERPFVRKSTHLLFLDREAFRRSKRGEFCL